MEVTVCDEQLARTGRKGERGRDLGIIFGLVTTIPANAEPAQRAITEPLRNSLRKKDIRISPWAWQDFGRA